MNAVQGHWQPRVVHIRFPLTRKATREIIDTKAFARSFPILAVTRSKTMPCVTVSSSPRHKGVASRNSRQNADCSQDLEKQKQPRSIKRNSSSVSKQCAKEIGNREKTFSDNVESHHERRRSTSLPVWPVTNPTTIASMSGDSYRELPKPKLNVDWSGRELNRRTSLTNGTSSAKSNKVNGSTRSERSTSMVRIKPPPRSCTPMSEYDPDRLNIGLVVKFLDTQDEDISKLRSDSVPVSRPRPFTVAHSEGKYGSRVVKSANSVHKVRRSPIAARRYRKVTKSQESSNRDLAVSPLSASEKRTVSRGAIKHHFKKMNRLASLAARYSPDVKAAEAQTAGKVTECDNEQSLFPSTENNCASPQKIFGRLKHKSATFHSFPTNVVESEVDKTDKAETADISDESVDAKLNTDRSETVPGRQSVVTFADTNGSSFNAINAIRLPSVFDNLDVEPEKGWVSGCNLTVAKQFQTMTISGRDRNTDQEPEVVDSSGATPSGTNSREQSRHSRHLSLVFSRERSVERSSSVDRNHRNRQTANWVKSCADEHKSKVIELKLTHGSPPI